MKTLLIGCGNSRVKKFSLDGENFGFDGELVTLDIDAAANPDIVWDLNVLPLPFDDDSFDEIHAYEVLEHLGTQGDYAEFFGLFTELWRITKSGGELYATTPWWESMWAWGDPGHCRVISPSSLVFLSQSEYDTQIGQTPMTDYRSIYKADWSVEVSQQNGPDTFIFVLKAVK